MFFKNWWPFSRKKQQEQEQEHPENNGFGSLEKVYTPADKLELGMYITELDRPWLGTPFKFQGFELKTEEEIRSVMQMLRPHRSERLAGWEEYSAKGDHFRVTVSWESGIDHLDERNLR